ncbi:MAG: hypothetical protein KBT04_07080 [Bacteroidales bacterium]|nr:hypothetical protein [Candidatus Colimorpha onthohippi]
MDDGSGSVEESLNCMCVLEEVGFSQMYITPHFQEPRFPNSEGDIKNRFVEFKKDVENSGLYMNLLGVGGEYRIDDGFVRRISQDSFLTVGQDEYILVELSLRQHRMGFEKTIYDLQMAGHQVILAHPERYHYLATNSNMLQQLKDQGTLFQCNILSLSGFYGSESRSRATELIEKGWVELLGTDLHNETYAKALREATRSRTVRSVLKKYHFLNHEL